MALSPSITEHLPESLKSQDALRILVADDNESDRLILRTIVRKEGHEVFAAQDGVEAVAIFQEKQPDLVLMDAMMPNMDGLEAARHIRELAGDNIVPIIFLTSLTDVTALADCLQSGGSDFLSKPYSRVILKAKIEAFARMRRLHAAVKEQSMRLLHEQNIAKKIFDNVAHPGCIDAPNIKHLLSPMAVFNGDLVLAARKPNGGMYVFLGDFTGHGLPAAIGAMPVSEIFYGMSLKGFSMQDILREVNKRLKRILPVGVFCCACMVELNFRNETLEYWVGGVPDMLLLRDQSGTKERLASSNLPLGILSPEKFNAHTTIITMSRHDRLYMWSDGIIEATNDQGGMFGDSGVDRVFEANTDVDHLFDELLDAVKVHTGLKSQDDDYTVVEVIQIAEAELGEYAEESSTGVGGPQDWLMTYELRPSTLRAFNPLPMITHLLMEVPGLRPHSGKIYTILAELYSNALEHGVLGLNSQLKSSPKGFSEYYLERNKRLQTLHDGYVKFSIEHIPLSESGDQGGALTVMIEDTGQGFDWRQKQSEADHKTEGYSGRGLPLISTMCDSVRYLGNGNCVEVKYVWRKEA